MAKETKLSIAQRIVAGTPDKALALSEIMNVLGVTKSNAFVYYTKCTKTVSEKTGEKQVAKPSKTDKVEQVIVEKAKETAKKRGQTAQGQSTSTKVRKVKEIDEMIANLAAQGQATPFGSLMK